MANYQEARVKLTNTQLNKSKSAAKNKTGTILRMNKKNFEDEELTHVKLSKAQISKILRSGGSFGKGAVRAGKGFTLFISNEDMNIIKIIKSLEDLGVLIDRVTEKVKREIKKTRKQISC